MHVRNVEDVIREQLQDPKLVEHFHWDAQRMFKWNGTRWVQFFEAEPAHGSMMWDVQVSYQAFLYKSYLMLYCSQSFQKVESHLVFISIQIKTSCQPSEVK